MNKYSQYRCVFICWKTVTQSKIGNVVGNSYCNQNKTGCLDVVLKECWSTTEWYNE